MLPGCAKGSGRIRPRRAQRERRRGVVSSVLGELPACWSLACEKAWVSRIYVVLTGCFHELGLRFFGF
eukprot:3789122-Alexandrium_andersonii.AAC.1